MIDTFENTVMPNIMMRLFEFHKNNPLVWRLQKLSEYMMVLSRITEKGVKIKSRL